MKALALLLLAFNASAFTLTPQGGGFTLLVCDDVHFTHYANGGLVHGKTIAPGGFVLTCPRTNATWHLTITGCPTHKVTYVGPAAYAFTC